MKMKTGFAVFALITLTNCFAQESLSPAYRRALRNGAKAKITMVVNSPNFGPISNALARLYFENKYGNQHIVSGMTDATGLFAGEGLAKWSVGGSVEKEGFYRSQFQLTVAR